MKTRFYQIMCLTLAVLLVLSANTFTRTGHAQGGSLIFLPIVGKNMGDTPPPPSEEWTDTEEAAIESIVNGAGFLEKLAEDDPGDPTTESMTQTIDGEPYWTDVESNYVVKNKTDLLYLGSNDDVLWPGALIEGDQAHEFVYTPITLPRAPLMLSVNLENVSCAGELTQEVVDPNLANMREGIRLLLQEARKDCTITAAQAEFNHEQVYNESHLNLAIGANVDSSSIDLDANFNWDDTSKRNKIITTYKQILYEININTPTTQADFFDPARTTVAEIGAAMPAGTDPMYVAGVKYGMMALMFFESNYSEENLRAAVELSYSKGVTATITGTLTAKNVLDASNINIVVYGGSTAGLETIYTGTEGFEDVIKASANGGPDAPGVPLVYKFRHFSDNNLAWITFTSDYSFTTNRFPVYPKIRVALDNFELRDGYWEDWPAITMLEISEMRIIINAKNRTSGSDPGTDILPNDRVIGHNGPNYVLMEVKENPPYDTWPPAPLPPVTIIYDNSHDPFYWDFAWLSVKGSVTESDWPGWPDPDDHAETPNIWETGEDILAGTWLFNEEGDPYRSYTFLISPGEDFLMACTIKITFLNP